MSINSTDAKHLSRTNTALLSDKVYNTIKWTAQYFLPALGTLYFALASIWGLPAAEQVVGTVVALDIFLGAVLGFSKKSYENSDAKFDGAVLVDTTNSGEDVINLDIDTAVLEGLQSKSEVTLKVVPPNTN